MHIDLSTNYKMTLFACMLSLSLFPFVYIYIFAWGFVFDFYLLNLCRILFFFENVFILVIRVGLIEKKRFFIQMVPKENKRTNNNVSFERKKKHAHKCSSLSLPVPPPISAVIDVIYIQ